MPSWEEMCQQIVIDGRPGDVTSAAFGWEQLLKNLNTVKQNLETNVKDLGETWKGPAYEAFKTHIEGIAKSTGEVVADAESRAGIVHSLKDAADKLSAAQAEFPIPASCVNDVLEARNARITISAGFFEMKVKPDFLGLADPISSMVDWFNDKTGDATKVYQQVSGQYLAIDGGLDAPTSTAPPTVHDGFEKPDLGGGGGGGGGGVPDIGGAPSTGGVGGSPSMGGVGSPPSIGSGGPGVGTGTHPDLSSGTGGYPGGGGYGGGGTGSLGDEYGSGLAGAGGGVGTLPGSGLGGGGLPSTTGLGSGGGAGGGAGLGGAGGMIPGGGSLGKAVSTGMPGMMGGAAGAGAGRGGAGRGAGRLGGGVGGMGGMAGGMGGAAGRGGAGTGKAAAGGVRGGAGVKGGLAGMGGGHGAGYGEEEAPRNTWLEEDEDVWGADGDAAPGILR
ncbi:MULTISPECIES: WXG100 family type VII secretion target [unclassified Micromonospora]|uniref:WXG100 family type VII secretion target n=1 Tax=unclassified Micromonospora TaxID=2617518 RepID=UPI002FEE7F20